MVNKFQDAVILKTSDSERIVLSRSEIKGIRTKKSRNYAAGTDDEKTIVIVSLEYAKEIGMDTTYKRFHETTFEIPVDEELKIVLAKVRGDAAAEVLFD